MGRREEVDPPRTRDGEGAHRGGDPRSPASDLVVRSEILRRFAPQDDTLLRMTSGAHSSSGPMKKTKRPWISPGPLESLSCSAANYSLPDLRGVDRFFGAACDLTSAFGAFLCG